MPRMPRRKSGRARATGPAPFDAEGFLESPGPSRAIAEYPAGQAIFSQGDACGDVFYLQRGSVKLSVLSTNGREAVVAMLVPGDFFGEGCLAGQPLREGSATAATASTVTSITKEKMVALLHKQPAMSGRFISHMLSRNMRIEEDLADQLFNSSEKRLARALLLLASCGRPDTPTTAVPKISQDTLAKMIGTTRSRVNFFLNKFKRLGFIEYNGGVPLKVNESLSTVVRHD
jgi:CRP/FNR family transcriptional regulator, cyclic AMP receptor protein